VIFTVSAAVAILNADIPAGTKHNNHALNLGVCVECDTLRIGQGEVMGIGAYDRG
jgi:hypothetical protein